MAWGRNAADAPLIHSFEPHVPVRFEVWADEVVQGAGVVSGLGGKQSFGDRPRNLWFGPFMYYLGS